MIFNKKNIIMVSVLYMLIFFVKAEATVKNSEFWNYSYSFYYDSQGKASRDYFNSFLNDKYITIDDKKIKINNDCEFAYYQVEKRPISYWMSNKTANYYTGIFNEKKNKSQ
ncbi:TPA: hypothetical protein ACS7ZY_001575 [Providencia alcalifaciens]